MREPPRSSLTAGNGKTHRASRGWGLFAAGLRAGFAIAPTILETRALPSVFDVLVDFTAVNPARGPDPR
jgi:hypothetical protein